MHKTSERYRVRLADGNLSHADLTWEEAVAIVANHADHGFEAVIEAELCRCSEPSVTIQHPTPCRTCGGHVADTEDDTDA